LPLNLQSVRVLSAHGRCEEGWFECSHIFDCVPQSKVQDGVPDCYDKSDEERQGKRLFPSVTISACNVISYSEAG